MFIARSLKGQYAPEQKQVGMEVPVGTADAAGASEGITEDMHSPVEAVIPTGL